MIDTRYEDALISPDAVLRDGLERMNTNGLQILLVVDENRTLLGTVTDGDIRRALGSGLDLTVALSEVMNATPRFVQEKETSRIHEIMASYKIRHVPILDTDHRVVDVVDWARLLLKEPPPSRGVPVVVMAGGKGTRLRPITKVLPKPLVPMGSRSLVERVMERFHRHGFDEFILTLNYKSNVIRDYFSDIKLPYGLSFVDEGREFLGTAGAVSLADAHIAGRTFMVTNCDIIVEANFADMLEFHREKKAAATVLSVLKSFRIPYGVLQVEGHDLADIDEKPEYHFLVNSGIYLLEPEILELMEPGKRVDMPDLLLRARDAGLTVAAFPYTGQWFDVGQWDQYRQAADYLERQ
jgi:dTDP-glucose pyrophosphorylase